MDVNDEWLEAAREVLGTTTKVSTINEALHGYARQQQAAQIIEALDKVQMDFADSEQAWRYGGERDLSHLAEDARSTVHS